MLKGRESCFPAATAGHCERVCVCICACMCVCVRTCEYAIICIMYAGLPAHLQLFSTINISILIVFLLVHTYKCSIANLHVDKIQDLISFVYILDDF